MHRENSAPVVLDKLDHLEGRDAEHIHDGAGVFGKDAASGVNEIKPLRLV